jgi:eukaryotic-like serine/threonine-protein kinase
MLVGSSTSGPGIQYSNRLLGGLKYMIDLVWVQQQFPEITGAKLIGRGGQKSVFSGTHLRDGEVVLKLFNTNVEVERVYREVAAAQNIPCARIPHVFEVGKVATNIGDVIWVREECVQGESLRDMLKIANTLSPTSVLMLAAHMLEALAAAEKVHIVHRDVKPDNIMVANNGTYWLVDFGIARHLDKESLTATALSFGIGTIGYASPEQFRNIKTQIDARADLFGLGVTLFECVEGYNFFFRGSRDLTEVFHKVETVPLPPLSRKVDSGGQFSDLILAMTRVQPSHRIATAARAYAWIRDICIAAGLNP